MAEMNWIIVFLACGTPLFIDLFLLSDSHSAFNQELVQVKKVRSIIIAGVFQTLIYLLEYFLYQYDFFRQRRLGMLVESILYGGNLLYMLAYADYVYAKYVQPGQHSRWKRVLFLLPVLALVGMAFANIFFPVFFNLTEDSLQYVETQWVMVMNVIPIGYILFAGAQDLREAWRSHHYSSLPVSLYFTPTLVGILLEGYYHEIPVVPISCAVSMMILYLRILKQIGYLDSLSGLFNKSQTTIYIKGLLSRRAADGKLAGIMLDVNRFKFINDNFGHAVGDDAIRQTGDILKAVTRKNGLCFRYGGDEFIVILRVTEERQVTELIQRLDRAVEMVNARGTQPYWLSLARGYAIYDPERDTVETFLERMDAEMYRNKRGSR